PLHTRASPPRIAWLGSAGVVRILASRHPVGVFSAMSVKVPPTSIPTRPVASAIGLGAFAGEVAFGKVMGDGRGRPARGRAVAAAGCHAEEQTLTGLERVAALAWDGHAVLGDGRALSCLAALLPTRRKTRAIAQDGELNRLGS